jgi:multidrug efflux pump subunit AcrA (membrane-fusion protein)
MPSGALRDDLVSARTPRGAPPRRAPRGLVTAGLALALASQGCDRGADKAKAVAEVAPAAAQEAAPPKVRFVKVAVRPLAPGLEASGTLAADETSEVAAQAAGSVVAVEVDAGSRVKKGDVLVRLDARDAALRLAQAAAAAEQARARLGVAPGQKFDPAQVADVRAAKEAMDLAVSDADRTKALVATGSVSQSAWDQARTRAEQARAQYDAALNGARQAWAALAAAEAQARLSQKQLDDCAIRAPFDGAIAERRITAGEWAPVGRVVAVVVHDDPLRLRLDVPEADAAKVTIGRPVDLTVAAYPGRTFHGAIKRIGASVKQQSRTLPVEAEVANGDAALRPGFFARAKILLGGKEEPALVVPEAAVGTTGTSARVFLRAGGRVVERLVTAGRRLEGGLVEIRGTLSASDEVAVDGVDTLSDGAEVAPL